MFLEIEISRGTTVEFSCYPCFSGQSQLLVTYFNIKTGYGCVKRTLFQMTAHTIQGIFKVSKGNQDFHSNSVCLFYDLIYNSVNFVDDVER